MPATLLAYADNQIYLILCATRYVISDDIIYELSTINKRFLALKDIYQYVTTDTFIYQCISLKKHKKTPEVCFKQLQEFDYYVLIVYFNNFL